MRDFKEVCFNLSQHLKIIPKHWDGKNAITEMKEGGSNNWKQMEWIGWYFEFICNKHCIDVMKMPYSKKYGNVSFDGFLEFPWDFKTHAKQSGTKVIVNDSEATSCAISEYGHVGLILAEGSAKYDNQEADFKKWHDSFKGGISNYETQRIERKAVSRKRKISFDLEKIFFIKIDDELLVKCGNFQDGFRNSNGRPRRGKVLLDLQRINGKIGYIMEFN